MGQHLVFNPCPQSFSAWQTSENVLLPALRCVSCSTWSSRLLKCSRVITYCLQDNCLLRPQNNICLVTVAWREHWSSVLCPARTSQQRQQWQCCKRVSLLLSRRPFSMLWSLRTGHIAVFPWAYDQPYLPADFLTLLNDVIHAATWARDAEKAG